MKKKPRRGTKSQDADPCDSTSNMLSLSVPEDITNTNKTSDSAVSQLANDAIEIAESSQFLSLTSPSNSDLQPSETHRIPELALDDVDVSHMHEPENVNCGLSINTNTELNPALIFDRNTDDSSNARTAISPMTTAIIDTLELCVPSESPTRTALPPASVNNVSTVDRQAELSVMHDQLSSMSQKLVAAQDHIDRLLEEKRSWLISASQPNTQTTPGELRGRWMQAKAQAEADRREKEYMVMKYAQSEQKCIQLERRLHELDSKSSVSAAEKVSNVNGMEVVKTNEKSDDEVCELQRRLIQMEKTQSTALEEVEALKKAKSSADAQILSLNKRLTRIQETLQSEQRKTATQSVTITRLTRNLETALKEASDAERLRSREAERLCSELVYNETKEQLKCSKAENDELRRQLDQMESIRSELSEKERRLSELVAENAAFLDVRSQLDALKLREEHLSGVTRRLTEQNVQLQTERLFAVNSLQEAEQKVHNYEALVDQVKSDSHKVIAEERAQTQLLTTRLNELTNELQQLRARESQLLTNLTTEREQATVTHKRDVARIRDLIRQLARVSQSHSTSHTVADHVDDIRVNNASSECSPEMHLISRTNSLHSVLSGAAIPSVGSASKVFVSRCNSMSLTDGDPTTAPISRSESVVNGLGEAERSTFISKIDRLQRAQLHLTDKVEFLQEHCNRLTAELNEKSRIIQTFVVTGKNTATTSSPPSTRVGSTSGFMASLYSPRVVAETPDRDVTLDISRKLQAVLEDTLLKNITFKDSLNILGSEVSRLTALLKNMQSLLCENCLRATQDIYESANKSLNYSPPMPTRVTGKPPDLKEVA